MTARLINGDCLEELKKLPARSVDCFICDLPYGQLATGGIKTNPEIKKKYKRSEKDFVGGCPWDVKLDLTALWTEIKRLCKDDHTPVLMFCNTKFGYELIKSNEEWFRYDLVWNKERGVSFLMANKMPMKSHEMIYVFSKKGAYYKRVDIKTDKKEWDVVRKPNERPQSRQYGVNGDLAKSNGGKDGMRCPLSVLNFKSNNASGKHPTEKPVELYKWLLERYCPENGTVLDPTAGSFNSIIAAKELGLNGIGIEKDIGFYDKANKKINPEVVETIEAETERNEIILN